MRATSLPLLLLPLLLPACASHAPYVIATADDRVQDLDDVADDLAQADVVALGELHRTPPVHETHHALLAKLHERRPNLVIALEMFERDTQTMLLKYLAGFVAEPTFLAQARPWPRYESDYRPVIEFAKAHGLVVLAANAPGDLVKQARREGLDAVRGNPHVAREVSTPEDDYREACLEAMRGHPGVTEAQLQSFYVAQCVRDDTMAETITDYLKERRQLGDRPLCVLICGAMHSDHGRGTVARIKSRMPDLSVRVVSAEAVDDLAAGVYTAPKTVGAYVVVAPKAASEPPQAPVATVDDVTATSPGSPAAKSPVTAGPTGPAATPPAPATQDPPPPEGARPGLGLMPDYGGSGDGLHVERVTEGGAAEKAGIEAGDVIVAFAGKPITDVESYMAVLGEQTVGKTVTVRVRRGDAEVDLQVKIGVSRR